MLNNLLRLLINVKNQMIQDLFDYIAEKLANFIAEEDQRFSPPAGKQRELGFTFSFPVMQTSINSGNIIRWSKGFSIDDAVIPFF